ncbi:gp58-like family protein [Leuconostoc citreum]|uniref:gp58-like family protein n=1 Tax=Leuconostoc citreum TaxID=33964 RepID=UPI0021A85096|nr:gp58-like family protein [Leuconostoc citreum]MCT3076707.1 hypothetical protein [Leuconostoc citreum]
MYTVLDENLQVKGRLSLNNGQGNTTFFSDTITTQMATDNANDPAGLTTVDYTNQDKQGNAKQWSHSLTISVEATDLGTSINTTDYLMYFDSVADHYYLMKVINTSTDRNSGFITVSAINAAIFELGKQLIQVEQTLAQVDLKTFVSKMYKNAPFSLRVADDNLTVIDYTISANTSLQALLQDLQTKFNVDVDSWVELDTTGHIVDRVLYFGHLGADNGELIRYGGAKGFENMTATEVSDIIYTKLYVTGKTDDKDAKKGHISSVNNGMEYIVDDDANQRVYAIGASQQQPAYLEGVITNTLLSEPSALLTWAKQQMSIFNHPRFNYTVSPLHDQIVALGDTVTVQDFHIKPEILVTSKVIQKTVSFASPETNTFVLGEFSSIFTDNMNKSANVINLIKKDVTVVQAAADIAKAQADAAHQQAVTAQEKAIHAQTSADGKTTSYTVDSVQDLPQSANEGDIGWVKLSDGTHMYSYTDGKWVEKINPSMGADIDKKVSDVVIQAKDYSDKAIADNQTKIDESIKSVDDKANKLKQDQSVLDIKAQDYANQAKADAIANTTQAVKETADNSQKALDQAKFDLTTGIEKETADRQNAVNALDTKAQGYADQAKTDAINAATTADGVINKKIDDTASSITTTISQNKTDANGKIATAQSTATQALDQVATKVSQTDYDKKTGQLQTDLTSTTQTANKATTDIVSIQQKDNTQDARMTQIESDASGVKTTVSDLKTAQGKQSGDISTLQQRADGFDATVTKVNNLSVGGRNLFLNSSTFNEVWTQADNVLTDNFQGLSATQDNKAWRSPKYSILSLKNRGVINENDTYVFSAWLKNTSSQQVKLHFYGTNNQISWVTNNNAMIGVLSPNSGWVRVSTSPFKFVNLDSAMETGIRVEGGVDLNDGYVMQAGLKLEKGTIATDWTPAPEDLSGATARAQLTADNATLSINNYKTDADGRISKAQADIVTNANAITQKVSQTDYNAKTGDLSTKVSTAQQTADQANTTIGDYKKANDGRVSSAESGIKQNKDAISSKVSQTDYDQKTGKLDGQISTLNQTAKDITTSIGKVSAQVNNLQVGGRNLLLGTQGWTGDNWDYRGINIDPSNTYNSLVIAETSGAWNSPVYKVQNLGILKVGSTYTFSTWVRNTSDTDTLVSPFYVSAMIGWKLEGESSYIIKAHTDWQHIYSVVTIIDDPTKITNGIRWEAYSAVSNGKIQFAGYKLEDGNLPTAWSPAPEDTDNKFSTQQQKIDRITGIVSDPNTGLTTRVQTAEGFMTNATDRLGKVENKAIDTADGLTREIKDRSDGDTNFFQQGKDFTTSQISNSETGMKSFINQTIEGLQIGAITDDISALKNQDIWQQISSDDMNILRRTGNFLITGGNRINAPVPGWFYIKVESPRTERTTQTAWQDQDNDLIYRRVFDGTKWSAWSQVVSSSTLLGIFHDSWSLGTSTNDGITKQLITGINGQPDGNLVVKGASIILDGNTTVTGDFYAKGGNFQNLNASNIKVGTLDGYQVNIANVNVNNLVGDTITGFNFNVNKQMTIASGGIIQSDVIHMDKDSFTVKAPNINSHRISSEGYKVFTREGVFNISSGMGSFSSDGNISVASDGNTDPYKKGVFHSEYGGNNLMMSATGYTNGDPDEFLNMSSARLDYMYSKTGLLPDATQHTSIRANLIETTGTLNAFGVTQTPRVYSWPNLTLESIQRSVVLRAGGKVLLQARENGSVYLPNRQSGSGGTSLQIAGDGGIFMQSSSTKYKTDIQYDGDTSVGDKFLTLDPATWQDKFEYEQREQYRKNGIEPSRQIYMNDRRYYGLIAEDLVKAGLEEFVIRDEVTGEVNGLEYDKVAISLIPVVREQRDAINELRLEVERLKQK